MSAFNHTDRAAASRRDTVAATLLTGIGAILWEADARTFAFTFVSREAEQVLGYPVEQWLNEPDFWRAHTHEEDVGWCSVFCADASAAGRDHTFEYRMIAADGRIVWIRDIVTVETAADGALLMRGVMIDVSDWHRADEQQRTRVERRARATFEDAAIGMAVVDLDARPLDTNLALQRLLGYTAEELRELTIPQFTHPDDVARDAELYAELLAGRRDHYQLEKRLLRKDGSVVWCKLTASLVRDSGGRPEYGVGMVEDITERKDLEARLLQRQKMEAVGRLAGGIAHDFNNLLTVIRGYSDVLMLGRANDDTVRSDAAEIRHAADRAAALIQQLLAFSRKQQLFPVLVDVNEIVDDVAAMLLRLIGEHVILEIHLAGEPLWVLADRGQIQQMLVNLALNARDAMPMGGTLTIETRRARVVPDEQAHVAPGEYVALVVTDTGVGISDDVLPRIFEPFFTTKDVGHGTGLGLATAYGIVDQSGGQITVSSRPGDGSTFTVLLPPASPTSANSAARPTRDASPSERATILLVEDEDSVRRLTKLALEQKGYRVLDAARGREALTIAHTNADSIDLIVTDIVMPAMSGPEMVRQFRTVHGRVPVVYMSGYADTSTFQAGELAEDEAFLAKPFHVAQLEECVKKALGASRG